MKKIKYILITLLLLIPFNVNASIRCSAPSSVESGETFGVTFYGSIGGTAPIWIGKIGSEGNVSFSSGSLNIAGEEVNDFSRTVYFTAGDPGSAKFYTYDIDVASDIDSFSDGETCYVEIREATRPNSPSSSPSYNNDDDDDDEEETEKSSNSYLKSFGIEGVKINPNFDKDKMNYTAVVNSTVEKIKVIGELEDEKAKVDGLGEKELKDGINKIDINVTAENGEVRTYTIVVTRKESNPIEVTINKKKYTIAKKDMGLKVPEGFSKSKVVIDKEEVLAYYNDFTKYTLVALVDEEGNASWYIYNTKNATYIKYSEFKSNYLRIVVLSPNKKDIPHDYKKCLLDINNQTIDAYYLELSSSYRLVYGLNMETGKKSFYLYDMEENTFQRFYNSQVNIYRELLKKLEIVIIGLLGILFIMTIIIICMKVVNKKTKKFIKNGGKIEEEIVVEEDEEEVKDKTVDNKLSKADKKKIKKEQKKELQKIRKDFFD